MEYADSFPRQTFTYLKAESGCHDFTKPHVLLLMKGAKCSIKKSISLSLNIKVRRDISFFALLLYFTDMKIEVSRKLLFKTIKLTDERILKLGAPIFDYQISFARKAKENIRTSEFSPNI